MAGRNERGANRKFGDMEASQRNLAMAGKPRMTKNCGVAGCSMLIPVENMDCGHHDFSRDEPHAYPRYEQKHMPFGGTTREVRYDAQVGHPESGKNKI